MKSRLVAALIVFACVPSLSEKASAQFPGDCGMFPFGGFGFYSPYGAQYGTSLRTPPYFATNPPVYYGARYARPYGMSPFAAPPMVTAPSSYRGRLESEFMQPPGAVNGPVFNPCVSHSKAFAQPKVAVGPVRENPFAVGDIQDKLALKE